ncbi:MAG TPA: ectoine/hydroxyectoine ABC transporter substrate-binding protein EhuB, partial [Dongiaceae bacterium]|nr:ectoine/hydroxyectoine ABC transporter substrate-binding protein EhuB [Dongiaceae bacterium]
MSTGASQGKKIPLISPRLAWNLRQEKIRCIQLVTKGFSRRGRWSDLPGFETAKTRDQATEEDSMDHELRVTRRGLLRSAIGLGAATAAMAGGTRIAFAETTLERAKAQGFIRVGFANEAPFGYATPDGKLTGEAPEVAKAVLAKIGIPQVDGVLTEFGSLIPGLKAGRFDIIAAGMFITPKRCAEIAYSEPSYGIGEAMLVSKGNPKAVKDFSTFAGNKDLKLAVMSGAVEAGYAKD